MLAHFVGLKRGDGEQQRLIPQLACIRDRSGGHPPSQGRQVIISPPTRPVQSSLEGRQQTESQPVRPEREER